jgi:hypothetical protein
MKKIIIFAVMLICSVAIASAQHDYTQTATSAHRSANYTVHIDEFPLTADWSGGSSLMDVIAGDIKTAPGDWAGDWSVFYLTGGDGRHAKCTMKKETTWPRLKLIGQWQNASGSPLTVYNLTPPGASYELWETHFVFGSDGKFDFQYWAYEIDASLCNGTDEHDISSHDFTLSIEVDYE